MISHYQGFQGIHPDILHRNKNQFLHTIANYYNTAKHFCKNFLHSYAIKSYT